MKLVTLGTAGYHPNEHRQTTCVVVPESGLVFDAGTSFFRLPRYLQTDSIDIFITHAHLDHCVGLTYLLNVTQQHPLTEVRVHGEQQKLDAIREHLFARELFPVQPTYVERPLAKPVKLHDGSTVSFRTLEHPGGAVGYRVDWADRSLGFITDTTASKSALYTEFISGVDLLIHECNFVDGYEQLAQDSGHSCLSPVAKLARAAKVGGLVLLHLSPMAGAITLDDVRRAEKTFSPIVLAEDGMEIDF